MMEKGAKEQGQRGMYDLYLQVPHDNIGKFTHSTSDFTLSALVTFSRKISASAQAHDITNVRHVTKKSSVHSY